MTKHTWSLVWIMLGAGVAFGQAANAPSVATVLKFRPVQADVPMTSPGVDEIAGCEVKEVRAGGAIVGWLLSDAKKQPLRKFYDSKGGKNIDTWSYFKDGVEVYREIDSNADGKADQFRWLNSAGMKWGVDLDGDAKIDAWRMISAEEMGHEIFQALAGNDIARFKALLISEAELTALKVADSAAERIRKSLTQASVQFSEARKNRANLSGAHFLRIESGPPSCIPAEAAGEQDLIKYPSRSVLYETAEKKHDWLPIGEMIKVGAAWRLVDLQGDQISPKDVPSTSPELSKLLASLDQVDKNPPAGLGTPKTDPKVQAYCRQRVALVKQILPLVQKNEEKETWWKQVFDNLSTAVQAGDDEALKELAGYRAQMERNAPGGAMTAYAAYRELWAIYAPKLAGGAPAADLPKVQEEWHDKLSKFVQAYPKGEDTPDALHQLAMGCEFNGKDEEGKRWYKLIHTNFPTHHLAEKAKGAERRLDLVGLKMELTGRTLDGQAYTIGQSNGKVVLVYYYASYINVSVGDFARMKQVLAKHAKDVDLICVNLDDNDKAARDFVSAHNPPGIHLFEPAKDGHGLSSRLATHYGINGLPTMFLVGRDGRVLNRTLQVNDLEEALRKAI